MSYRYYQPGFQSTARKRKQFVPSEEQLEKAMYRIRCTIEKFNGAVWGTSEGDAINFLERHVYNRDNQLGSRRQGHFRKVLLAAWRKLVELKQVVYDAEASLFTLNYRFDKPAPKPATYSTHQRRALRFT